MVRRLALLSVVALGCAVPLGRGPDRGVGITHEGGVFYTTQTVWKDGQKLASDYLLSSTADAVAVAVGRSPVAVAFARKAGTQARISYLGLWGGAAVLSGGLVMIALAQPRGPGAPMQVDGALQGAGIGVAIAGFGAVVGSVLLQVAATENLYRAAGLFNAENLGPLPRPRTRRGGLLVAPAPVTDGQRTGAGVLVGATF